VVSACSGDPFHPAAPVSVEIVDLTFRILGPLRVEGAEVRLGPRKQRAILAMLLLEPGRVVPMERLIAQLWGDRPPAGAVATVRVHISHLRRGLEAGGARRILVTRDPGYLLDVAPEQVDASRFTARAEAGQRLLAAGDAAGARAELDAALAEWHGAPLAEFAAEPFAGPAVTLLEDAHAEAVQGRAEARLALGDAGWCVTELSRLTREMPYRERLWELYAAALYRAGRPADALSAVREVRTLLDDELGISPGPALGALEQAILRQDNARIPGGAAVSRS
jgi:DNA-binding SARP family transcriptional activator